MGAMMTRGVRGIHTSAASFQLYDGILDTIGRTPIVRVNNVAPKHVTMYAKCEFFNPCSSVKDRLAFAIVDHAEKTGALKPGQPIVEATSGNTGIALAMVCAQKGYPLYITMAESFSIERRRVMRSLGAKVILTPASERGTGMVKKAQELAEKNGWFLARQFESEANAAFHAQTTGPEILSDFAGKNLDYFVLGYGTGGTFTGAGRVIKEARPSVHIALAEPSNAALISSGVSQERSGDNSPAVTHPAWSPHPIQGWTPDFIPHVAQEGLDKNVVDQVLTVTGDESVAMARRLMAEEGIFTGISGGGSFAAACKVADTAPPGSTVLVMLPDTAERYLSTPLYQDIPEYMTEEEIQVSASTPNYQMS